MKNMMEHVALVISFLAALQLLVKELALTELIADDGPVTGWTEALVRARGPGNQ